MTTETTHAPIVGSVFIVPNGLWSVTETGESSRRRIRERIQRCGWTIEDNEPLVQLWFHNDENDNWTSHYYAPFLESINGSSRGYSQLPEYVPARVLRNLREGEDLVFVWTNWETKEEKIVKVTADQLHFRYRRHGAFHDVLAELVEHWESRQQAVA